MVSLRRLTKSPTSRRIAIPALALMAVLGLAGCSVGVNGAADGASNVAPAPGPMMQESLDASGNTVSGDRSVIVTGWATILVDDPQAAATAAVAIVDKAGGRIDSRSLQAPTDYSGGSATLTIRVPADSLDGVIGALEELGRVQSVTTNASDVTLEVQDLDARIDALRTSIDRLEALQADAVSIDALIQLETAISDRQAQLESLQAQQRYYDDQITMSTMTVELVSQAVLAEPEPGSFWDGIQAGWEALGAFFAGLVVVLGVLIPWLIPLIVIAAIVWLIIFAATRPKRPKPGQGPPPAGPPVSD